MDLLRSHKTASVKQLLREHDITLSLVPSGCTSLVQPLDVSVNRPFKDLLKQAIDDELEKRDEAGDDMDIAGESAVGKMRVMMTHCVAEAWTAFTQKKREVMIKSFRQLGLSLPLDGSSDGEISIKGLDTPILMDALREWRTQGVSSVVPPHGQMIGPPLSESETISFDSAASDSDEEVTLPITDDGSLSVGSALAPSASAMPHQQRSRPSRTGRRRGRRADAGRGSGEGGRPAGGLEAYLPIVADDSPSVGSALVPSASARPQRGRPSRTGRRRGRRADAGRSTGEVPRPTGELGASLPSAAGNPLKVTDDDTFSIVTRDFPPHSAPISTTGQPTSRRSARIAGQVQSYIFTSPNLSEDLEEDDDGVEYHFRWQADEF